jgi:hypothetical protein
MRWFRSHSSWGVSLALSALALQLVLSFGHIHHKDITGEAHPSTNIEPASGEVDDHDSQKHEDHYCAIYAINTLLGCLRIPAPPVLALPLHVSGVRVATVYDTHIAERRRVPSQARAPPVG